MGVFLNYSNHPSDRWSSEQLEAAKSYGEIHDLPFPAVDAVMDEEQLEKLAKHEFQKILKISPDTVLCQGEFTLAYCITSWLRENGIRVVAACSQRDIIETIDAATGESAKTTVFKFVRFREYMA